MKTVKLLLSVIILFSGIQLFAGEHKGSPPRIHGGSRSMLLITPLSGGGFTASDLVESILPPGTPYSNINYYGPEGIGFFDNGWDANLDLTQGVVFGNGCLDDINNPDPYGPGCTDLGLQGDDDLDNLGFGYETYDGIHLEFDFIPTGGTLPLKIIYATREVSDEWDDPCGIFLDGSNIAVLPGGSTEISLPTIWDTPYFHDNNIDGNFAYYSSTFSISAQVTPNETHHLKFVIADGYDHSCNTYLFTGQSSKTLIPIPWWSVILGLALIIGFTSYRFITTHRG